MSISPEDRSAIVELAARYCHAVDFGDGEALAALFTEDGAIEAPIGSACGPEMIRSMAEAVYSELGGSIRHWLSNQVVESNGPDAARMVSYFTAMQFTDVARVVMHGRYHDEFVRTADGWRFRYRRIDPDFAIE